MAKYLLALSIAFALLLAGCAGIAGNWAASPTGKGTVLVKVQDVVAGCGVQPPDNDTSACGVHSSAPYIGNVNVNATYVSGIDLAIATPKELEARALPLGTLTTNSNGEIRLELPAGDYLFKITKGNDGIESALTKIEAGKTTPVAADFVKQVPGARPS